MELIMEALEKNAKFFPNEVALVEINPAARPAAEMTWREYTLIETSPEGRYRRDMNWREFDTKANRFANLLLTRNVKKGDKVGILLMNGIEWLPIYFGILKAGCLAVPLNYRYTADEIEYCLDLADASMLVFGLEFIERPALVHHKSCHFQSPPFKNSLRWSAGEPGRTGHRWDRSSILPSR